MRKREKAAGNSQKPPMSRGRKIVTAFAVLAALGVIAIALAYVFAYDGFHIVYHALSWDARLPEDMELDMSLSEKYVTGRNDYLYVRVSKESSPYLDVQEYIDHYFDRFYMSPDWQEANNARILRDETRGKEHIITLRVGSIPEGYEDTYSFITLRTNTRYFIRALLKYDSRLHETEGQRAVDAFADSLGFGFKRPGHRLETDYAPVVPDNWSEETRETYRRISEADGVWFGAFSADIDALEERLERELPVALTYFHLNEPLPVEKLEDWYEQGKLTELTLQMTVTANDGLDRSPSPLIDVTAGRYDEALEAMAAALKDFGHPVLFRLNNEMNSDWTSYSGVVNLADPELYIAAWRYVYDFFEDRGVDNTIWIWNPNDRDFPPANWNSWTAYWPGNGYAHILGVTGYNNGTYYARETGEEWRSFTKIYDDIDREFAGAFDRFPWMITEFSSSSVGGDKPGWIEDMFAHMGDYERIKIAVWFDYADFDYSKPDAPVARPYWLAETEETLNAFKKGLDGTPDRFFE